MQIKLTPEGLVIKKDIITIRLDKDETKRLGWDIPEKYPSPEVVHLEISNRCQLNCNGCYIGKKEGNEIDTTLWKQIINKLKRAEVWQVTFGGGEPTLRNDLIDLAEYVKGQNLNLTMTTNGINISKFGDRIKIFDQINVSYHRDNIDVMKDALYYLRRLGIRQGINYVYDRESEDMLCLIKNVAKLYDAEILFLTYKPINGDSQRVIEPIKVYNVAYILSKEYPKIAVDGLTCNKCYAGKRFCDIDSLGNVYPCSFIRQSTGNLLEESFDKIWDKIQKMDIECPYKKIN